ncbi:MAG: SPFH domain-containing protein [Planctomycetota bacterium]|jgi:regulator of protease activity HflC (stomatin/prohibitin superfamily)
MTRSSKRAEYLARISLALSILFFLITLLMGLWSGDFAVFSLSWLVLNAVLIWFVLCFQFHHHSRAEQERLDAGQLAKDKATSTIFEAGDERASLFAVAQRRLELFEKWFLPIFSAVIAVYQLGIGLFLLVKIPGSAGEVKEPLLVAVFMAAIAFVSFLLSRYATSMSSQLQWKPLRAGGSITLGVSVSCFVLSIALSLAYFNYFGLLGVLGYYVPILLMVLGVETALNVVLDIYRPRLKGQYARTGFDSRLLGLVSEPGGILRTAAGAIDYQFGFEVSQTWFYKLLEKAIVPLALFGVVTLYLLSCFVVVTPSEEAIIEHFGNPVDRSGQPRLVGPGLTFKWPWPIDRARKYRTKKVSEISIGFVPKADAKHAGHGPLLWGKMHYEKEEMLLVASESDDGGGDAVPVSLLVAAVPVQYRVKDLYAFMYDHNDPERLLECICYSELANYAAGATIEVDDPAARQRSLLGAGRAVAKEVLTKDIQEAVDKAGLGIEIVFVGLQGIHPPPDVAKDYQAVIGAGQKRQAAILAAEAERNWSLSSVAGSVEDAEKLFALAGRYQQAKQTNDQAQIEELARQMDKAFAEAGGAIFSTLSEAQSYAFERAKLSEATGRQFQGQLQAYRAAPFFYKGQHRLAALEEALKDIRKYVVATDPNDKQTIIIDWLDELTPSVYDITGHEKESDQK